jgi:hypothetical protein
MNSSNFSSKNDTKQNAGSASAEAQSNQGYLKPNGGKSTEQNPGTKGNDKQDVQSQKTDGASSKQGGKESSDDETSHAVGGTQPGADAGKSGEASSNLSAKSNG